MYSSIFAQAPFPPETEMQCHYRGLHCNYWHMQFQGSYVLIHLCTGSSAPEILLAVIGIIGNNFESEKLGPSTIVGSVYMLFLLIFVVICDFWFWHKVWCSPTAGLPRSTCLPSRRSASPGCRPTRSGGSRPSPSSSSPPSSPSSPTSGSWSSWGSAAR